MKIETKKQYVRIDAWGRGYYTFKNSVYSSVFLSMDDYNNKTVWEEIERIKSSLRINKIPCRVIRTRTSNCSSVGVDVLVPQSLLNNCKEVIRT